MPASALWTRRVLTVLGLWLLVACAVGWLGFYENAPAPVVGGTNAVLVALGLAAVFGIPGLREWSQRVSLRPLVLYHLVRFVGVAFLALYARGVIPGEFAIVAGWGDIAVAVLAIPVALFAIPVTTSAKWWALFAWNVFGLADILMVLGNGMRLGLADAAQMNWITAFPLSLLPTFIVPLVIITHMVIFARLWALRRQPAAVAA